MPLARHSSLVFVVSLFNRLFSWDFHRKQVFL